MIKYQNKTKDFSQFNFDLTEEDLITQEAMDNSTMKYLKVYNDKPHRSHLSSGRVLHPNKIHYNLNKGHK